MPHAPDLSGCALDDRYELQAVIGEGAFGRVYRGHDRRLKRTVAIKLIKPWWAEDPEWAQSFEREAQLLARVSDPGIVQIFDVGHAPEGVYYVSELVEGESLAGRLARGPIPAWHAAAIAQQLCQALARAHAQSVVHRDVKPANILITLEGRVKVGDFGVARLAESSSDGAGATVVGTPRYMAPEQSRGRATTPATDVYSAGIVLYEMIAGRPPFTERAAVELALRHLRDRPPPLPAATPAPLTAIVTRALSKSPQRRFADGAEMAQALTAALAQAPARTGRGAPSRDRDRDGDRARTRSHSRGRARAGIPAGASSAGGSSAGGPSAGGPSAGGPESPPRSPGGPESPPRSPVRRRGRVSAASGPPTRRAPERGPRRNLNPSGRRRSLAALAGAFALLAAMIVTALMIGAHGQAKVPRVLGLRRARIEARAHTLALRLSFASRYSGAPRGTAIAQSPRAGRVVAQGAIVHVVLSAGPPPVHVPQLAGQPISAAHAWLSRLGLRMRVTTISAPGVPAGTVTSQSPAPGSDVARSSAIALDVAQTPHWQPLVSVHGSAVATTARFHVRGGRWRIVYTMSYQGTCTFVFVCSGPTATVTSSHGGASQSFGLSDGGRQTQTFIRGAADYVLRIVPGSDTARWSAWIEDWY